MTALLILHTGGTIGMRPGRQGLQTDPDFIDRLKGFLAGTEFRQYPITVHSLPPIDSANLQTKHWQAMATHLHAHWTDYAGFIILHGTDTLAWSAAALSFMFQGCDKPIIFTGAQIPLSNAGGKQISDAPANLRLALTAARQPQLKEVCIAFGGQLLRGNRARKIGAQDFVAFVSPNYPVLGRQDEAGKQVFHVEHFLSEKPQNFCIPRFLPHALAVLPIYPGISSRSVKALLAEPNLRAIILQTYGSGNVPDADSALIESLRAAQEQGVFLVNTTQCWHGQVAQETYATGSILKKLGVIPLADITPEAAHAKLNFLLASEEDSNELKKKISLNLAGEMISPAQ
ncbi:asparaginase [Azonexus sp.]|uniref:asparaginase n=1 Tax=Azonexus sp. TaxID=1872668 RepID=UPI0039E5243C